MASVAELAKVSVFTVSAVVNGTSTVSKELRARVEAAIRASGYKRNAVARSLKTGQTLTVGVTIGDVTNPFYTEVVAAIQRTLHDQGYAVMLCCNDRSVSMQREHVALLRDRMVDGLIIAPTGDDRDLTEALGIVEIPVVLIDRVIQGIDCDAVVLDNRAAVAEAMGHLIEFGHRRVGFISGSSQSFTGRERLGGYHAALSQHGLTGDAELVQPGDFRIDDAYHATVRLLTQADPPTAIISANNQMVIGVMKAIRDLGLRCPLDVSVAGIDDFPWADAFDPQLTTVAQPVREIGQQAAFLLLARLHGRGSATTKQVVLNGELRVRRSCAPPRNRATSAVSGG